MDMAIRSQDQIQARQNVKRILVVKMVKKAIDQNKIEGLSSDAVQLTRVSHPKITAVLPPGVPDVVFIYINSEIIHVNEVLRICPRAASHVEHTACSTKVVSLQDRGELLLRKW